MPPSDDSSDHGIFKTKAPAKVSPTTKAQGDSNYKVLLFIFSIIAVHVALFLQYKQTNVVDLGVMPSAPPHVEALVTELEAGGGGGKLLDVRFEGGQSITEPGVQLAKADTQTIPTLSKPGLSTSKRYVAVCLDLDPPFPSFPIAGPIVHWIQPSLTASSTGELSGSEPPIAHYRGPGPPPISAPHRYVFMLYEQPDGFDVEALRYREKSEGEQGAGKTREITMWERVRWRHDLWERKAGLGKEGVVAGNVYVCNK
ncbi:MAG: hypothetical protein M1828_000631 [Chrysothrix sp. TS-e1954]|nr:MAG: hypothetical protein M1828_000631 [Chrysothrix sp. TS-e1954]